MAEPKKSGTGDVLGLIAGILGLIAAVLVVGPKVFGYESFRDMTCKSVALYCKAESPPPSP